MSFAKETKTGLAELARAASMSSILGSSKRDWDLWYSDEWFINRFLEWFQKGQDLTEW